MYTCNGNNELFTRSEELSSIEGHSKVSDLLKSWNLPQLCDKFEEQQICENALRCLNAEEILELIPKVGPRSIFRTALQKWKSQIEIRNDQRVVANKGENSSDDCLSELPMIFKEEFNETERRVNRLQSHSEEEEDQSSNIATTDEEMEAQDATTSDVTLLQVREILNQQSAGRKALQFYKEHNYLDSHSRRLCVQTITNAAIECGAQMPPRIFNSIALQMVDLFPTEHLETYYMPRQGPINPRGMLHHRYFNTCRRLRHQGLLKNIAMRRRRC